MAEFLDVPTTAASYSSKPSFKHVSLLVFGANTILKTSRTGQYFNMLNCAGFSSG